jgi:DNA helicase-2/ATP-dependent DNA helicase PcrA
MMQDENYKAFGQSCGLTIATEKDTVDGFISRADNAILNEINLARIKGLDLKTHYNQSSLDIEWFHFEYVERAYRQYKLDEGLLDFTDLLELIVQEPFRLPKLDALIVDESQDLSRLQWQLVKDLAKRSDRVYLAGDDDQAIYNWAGADVDSFLTYPGEVRVLNKSYRIPAKVHRLAERVVKRIRHRQSKDWSSRDEEGSIQTYNHFAQVDMSEGEWLVMAAANYMLDEMPEWLKGQGLLFERHGTRSIGEKVLGAVYGWETLRKGGEVPLSVAKIVYGYLDSALIAKGYKTMAQAPEDRMYSIKDLHNKWGLLTDGIWHEVLTKISASQRQYIIALLRRGTKLNATPKIKLSTIHGAKGGEADNVLLLTDLSTKFAKSYDTNPDDINRLLYVGITRTRNVLHLVLPQNSQKGFRL